MLNKKKILSIASGAVAIIAITGSVYAATSTTTDTTQPVTTSTQVQEKHGHTNQELLTLLGIDGATLKQDYKAGQSLADIAASKNVEEQKVIDLLVNQQSQRINQAVTSGKLTQAQADQKKAKLADEVKKRVETKGGFGEKHGRGHGEGSLKDVASILNTSTTDLQTQLKAGQTIAQIAQTKGIAESDLVNQLLQKDKDRLTKMVEKTWNQKDDAPTSATQPATTPSSTDSTTTNTTAASTSAAQ